MRTFSGKIINAENAIKEYNLTRDELVRLSRAQD